MENDSFDSSIERSNLLIYVFNFSDFDTTPKTEYKTENNMYREYEEYVFHLGSELFGFRRTQYITSIGLFYKEVGRLWEMCIRFFIHHPLFFYS